MNAIRKCAAAAMCAAAMLPLAAQAQSALETRLEERTVVVAPNGEEAFAPADGARPGDLIEYVATYRNTSRQPIRDLEVTLPIPHHTEFVPGSAQPPSARAGVDLRAFGRIPLKRVSRRDGRRVEEEVPLLDYRYLRWYPGELPGGGAVSFTARVRVVDQRAAGRADRSVVGAASIHLGAAPP